MQYTLRNVPDGLDAALRRRAREESKSLNEFALEALARGVGYSEEVVRQRELQDLAGRWEEDPEFDQAISDQDTVDPDLWK
jgi:plasmid stability protein